MMHAFKKIIAAAIISVGLMFGFSLNLAQAASGVPFGGYDVFAIPCTCSAGSIYWNWFAPLYLGGPVPITGALVSPITPTAFPNYYVRPATWSLGYYAPGSSAAACWIGSPPYCVPLPNMGLITPFTGVSAI